ncbi:MAG: hypothetical protein RR600_06935 [Aurantimicrobium sp.]|uniref:phage adaptor protein n=1 Tax=Aurantimicrobium sp. TaxID=1930784 RepID=UPI003220888F
MNLREIRELFVKHSGRYDLVNPDNFDDNGANFFVQAGQRMLDRMDRTSAFANNQAVSVQEVSPREQLVQLPEIYNITKVEWGDGISPPHVLEKQVVGRALRAMTYMGTPRYWEQALVQYKPSIEKLATALTNVPAHYFDGAQFAFHSTEIRLFPIPAQKGFIAVTGHYYASQLLKDEDESVWSIKHPDLLVSAALWALEVFYRNTEGARDWMNHIALLINEQDARELEGNIYSINQMRG